MAVFLILLALALIAFLAYAAFYCLLFHAPLPDAVCRRMLSLPVFETYRERIATHAAALNRRLYSPESVTASDTTRLYGRYYHGSDGAPLVLMFHGYRGSPMNFFPGIAEHLLANGFNLLIVDQRAHGCSEGHAITFGVRERTDVLNWVDYAVHRFGSDTKIVLFGVSMGAASVLMASEFSMLSQNCVGIIADCPYTTPEAILGGMVHKKTHLPDALIRPLIRSSANFFGRFDLSEVSAVDAVRHTHLPILLLHGEADTLVPCEMSEEIRLANPERIERRTFPDAEHAGCFFADEPRYLAAVDAFLARING